MPGSLWLLGPPMTLTNNPGRVDVSMQNFQRAEQKCWENKAPNTQLMACGKALLQRGWDLWARGASGWPCHAEGAGDRKSLLSKDWTVPPHTVLGSLPTHSPEQEWERAEDCSQPSDPPRPRGLAGTSALCRRHEDRGAVGSTRTQEGRGSHAVRISPGRTGTSGKPNTEPRGPRERRPES